MKIEKLKECYYKLKQIIGNDIVVEPGGGDSNTLDGGFIDFIIERERGK